MDAVEDGTTLQILYEGRTADAALNDKHGFETQFENLFKDRTEEELDAIKKSMAPQATFWKRSNVLPLSRAIW